MLHGARLMIVLLLFSLTRSIRIGEIENNIMIGTTSNFLMNLTREKCICQMIRSGEFSSAVNYFLTNQTCQLFYFNTSSVVIQSNLNASFIFLNRTEISITVVRPNSTFSSSLIDVFWSFDGNLNERSLSLSSVSINNVSYSSPGITGYGSALCLNASLNQYVLINSTVNLNLSFKSFTFEFWIYPFSLPNGDRGIIGQCQSHNSSLCLHLTLRSGKVRMSFYSNPCDGSTNIAVNTWYHLTFVYDYLTLTQMTYINGISECNHSSSSPLQLSNFSFIPLTIGYTSPLLPYYFDGLIDQLSIVEWVKNTSEILNDATLVAWYNFNDNSWKDSGPNGIDGDGVATSFENNSLLFNRNKSYFQSSGFVLLGISNSSYSFSIWINPRQRNQAAILNGYQNTSTSSEGCLSFLKFNAQGQIQAQSPSGVGLISVIGPFIVTDVWTHIAQTYSQSNGVRLYINGTLFNQSSPCDYHSSQTPLSLQLGNVPDNTNQICLNRSNRVEQYMGLMDEFRVYSRELTSNDVQTLSMR